MFFAACIRQASRFILLILFFQAVPVSALDHPDARILVLNSYHAQYNWTDQIVDAITKELARAIPRENVYIEYMDSRKRDDADYYEMIFLHG